MISNDVASILQGGGSFKWAGSAPIGTAAVVTYSFTATAPSYFFANEAVLFEPLSSGQRVHARKAFDAWADHGGITFVEVPDSVGGDIRVHLYDMVEDPSLAGFAYFPPEDSLNADDIEGDIFLDADAYASVSSWAPGNEGYSTFLHEIGHAIGFKHPFEGDPTINPARDNGEFTVLSYDTEIDTVSIGSVDKQALKYLYGATSLEGSWNTKYDAVQTTGSSDDEVIFGWRNNDLVYAEGGDDTVTTGDGKDRIYDGLGDDNIKSGNGDDYVRVGGGKDIYDGGSGVDYISYYDSTNGVTVNLDTNEVSRSWASNDTIKRFEGVSGSRTGDDVIFGTSGDNVVRTYGGDDRVTAGSGGDKIELGSGDDYVRVGGGVETFDGGSGKDYISYYSSAGGIRIDLRDDEVSGSWANNDTIKDFESGSGSNKGDDLMLGTSGANTLKGFGGDDKLYGRGGGDRLFGGDGNDFLDGGAGSGTDLLYGGAGEDIFEFDRGEGIDIIKDFENNIDTIHLDNFDFGNGDAYDFAEQVGSDVVFDFGSDGMLTVEDTTINRLQNDLELV